jgi:hypothetical protein
MNKFLVSTAFLSLFGIGSAQAEQLAAQPLGHRTTSQIAASASPTATGNAFTIGYLSPAIGAVTLGISPNNPMVAAPLFGQGADVSTYTTTYKTQLYGSQIDLTSGFTNDASLFTSMPTAGWNFGAAVGYAGFYVHGGLSDATQMRLTSDPSKGWLAGFGYQTGAFNVRLSYMTAQNINAADAENRTTWMIGGIYQISARVRVNADAFTSREPHLNATTIAPPMNTAAPQGTGARVGVQLRF